METDAGWRAAAAYPVRLYVPDEELADALTIYGVPVVSAACASHVERVEPDLIVSLG